MLRPIAVTTIKRSVVVLYREIKHTPTTIVHSLRYSTSTNGTDFLLAKEEISLKNRQGKTEKLEICDDWKLTKLGSTYVLSYVRDKNVSVQAVSADGKKYTVKSEQKNPFAKSIAHWQTNYVAYKGEFEVTTSISKDLSTWKETGALVLSPRRGFFDSGPLYIIGTHTMVGGILVVYGSHKRNITVGAILFSHKDPHRVIWRSENSLFEKEFPLSEQWRPFGTLFWKDTVWLYIGSESGEIRSFNLPQVVRAQSVTSVQRVAHNPILSPHPGNDWENEAVFNPAAFMDNENVHLLYRAVGSDGLSVMGYAKSPDGLFFDRAHHAPVYKLGTGHGYERIFYPSGGSSGGSEDPRAVVIDDRIYVTYVYFGNWDFMRMAVTSISVEDFRHKKWNWSKPILLSPQGQMHKNWVLFPEKINGKFAILHSISPEIKVDYVSDFKKIDIESSHPAGGRKGYWDNKVRGAGPPPIKTKYGWLLLYHANDAYDPHRYKIGAMLLDLNDPTKVLYRASRPVLSPDMHYENEGKPGIVYASGAIVKDGRLFIYYGGGDRVVCTATADLEEFLKELMTGHDIHLEMTTNLKI